MTNSPSVHVGKVVIYVLTNGTWRNAMSSGTFLILGMADFGGVAWGVGSSGTPVVVFPGQHVLVALDLSVKEGLGQGGRS